jgi:hypothetical protein
MVFAMYRRIDVKKFERNEKCNKQRSCKMPVKVRT